MPKELRYDPATNPKGIRPTIWDVSKATYGTDPKTGFGLRTFDNTGVQYGLEALNAGTITPAQFIDLNAKIGGLDRDDNYVPARTSADLSALKSTYELGTNLGANGGLSAIPIIDFGSYNDTSGYHYQWYHFAVRDRLKQANGTDANYVMWRGDNKTKIPVTQAADVLTKWVAAIKADNKPGTAQERWPATGRPRRWMAASIPRRHAAIHRGKTDLQPCAGFQMQQLVPVLGSAAPDRRWSAGGEQSQMPDQAGPSCGLHSVLHPGSDDPALQAFPARGLRLVQAQRQFQRRGGGQVARSCAQ